MEEKRLQRLAEEERGQKGVVNHFAAGSNCQVFNAPISGCVFAMPGSSVTQVMGKTEEGGKEENVGAPMPDVLASEEAMRLWDAAREAGWVDEHYQPLVSRTKAAVLADHMAGMLGIGNKWKVFEKFWKRNNMRGDYNDALDQQQYGKFLDIIKKIIY